MLPVLAPVLIPKVMPFELINDTMPTVWVPPEAATELIPVCAPPTVGPEIQSVLGPPPAVDSLTVMLLVPANTQSMPVEIPVLPAVFPVFEAPSPLIAD